MKEHSPPNDDGSNNTMQHKRAGEVGTEPLTVAVVFVAEMEVSGYGNILTSEAAG
jgi:hypothetical protein